MALVDTILASCSDVKALKQSGQRQVFKAVHSRLGPVVVKYSQYRDQSVLERLTREAAFLEAMDSPCLAKVHSIVVEPATQECVIVEAFIEGRELAECTGQFTTEEEIVGLVRALVVCLEPVWAQKVVHRDLKPRNILIDGSKRPRVVDFGIARFLDQDSLTNSFLGGPATPAYAAPEQLLNKKVQIDLRTDFFALGIVALELHLRQHPFHPSLVRGQSIPHNIIAGNYMDPMSKGGTSDSFARLINRLLQTQPYLRYRDAKTLLRFLDSNWRK